MIEEFPRYWEHLHLLRKVLIGESWILHILIATFTLGAGLIAPVSELLGVVRRQERYDRLARGLTLVNLVLYAVGATMAVAGLFLTWGFFPTFLPTLWWQFYWGLVAAELAWLGELAVLLLYYFLWDKLSGRAKPLHVLLGLLWLPLSAIQQAVLFPMVDFMMTPTPAQPYFNPSVMPQLTHRFMGNLSWTGFAIAAFAGIQYLRWARRGDPEKLAFWDWVGAGGAVLGLLAFGLFMPLSGYSWVAAAKGASPGGFHRMMVGPLAWMFQLVVFFVGMTVTVACYYLRRRLQRAGLPTRGLAGIGLAALVFWLLGSIPYFLGPGADTAWVRWTIPLGSMRPWKYVALLGLSLSALAAGLVFLQHARDGLDWGRGGRRAQRALITTGLLAASMMTTMGIIREKTKLPGLVHGQMNSQQQVIPPGVSAEEDLHRPRPGARGE